MKFYAVENLEAGIYKAINRSMSGQPTEQEETRNSSPIDPQIVIGIVDSRSLFSEL